MGASKADEWCDMIDNQKKMSRLYKDLAEARESIRSLEARLERYEAPISDEDMAPFHATRYAKRQLELFLERRRDAAGADTGGADNGTA